MFAQTVFFPVRAIGEKKLSIYLPNHEVLSHLF
jgi:hypothetical protein